MRRVLRRRRRRRGNDALEALEVGRGRGDGLVVVQVGQQVAQRLGQGRVFGREAGQAGGARGRLRVGTLGMARPASGGLQQRGRGAQLPLSWLWDGSLF